MHGDTTKITWHHPPNSLQNGKNLRKRRIFIPKAPNHKTTSLRPSWSEKRDLHVMILVRMVSAFLGPCFRALTSGDGPQLLLPAFLRTKTRGLHKGVWETQQRGASVCVHLSAFAWPPVCLRSLAFPPLRLLAFVDVVCFFLHVHTAPFVAPTVCVSEKMIYNFLWFPAPSKSGRVSSRGSESTKICCFSTSISIWRPVCPLAQSACAGFLFLVLSSLAL